MNPHDDDLRRALHDAVSDVQPFGTLDDIRSRTDEVTPMKRWFLPTLAVAAVMAAVVGGAFWLVNGDEQAAGPSGTPSQVASPDASASESTAPDAGLVQRAVPVYFVGDTAHGKKLFREFQQQKVCPADDCLSEASANAAVAGNPVDPDYSSPWPTTADVDSVDLLGDTLTVNLIGDVHERPAGMSEADAGLAIQQLIFSAQAGLGQGRVPVQLLIDGNHTDTVLGVPASEPLAAANADDVLAPVQVDDPTNGATVSGTFTVTGRAAAFEANVVWELKRGDEVAKHHFATAQECCTLSPYSFTVKDVPPGTYTLVVHDEDMSGEGRPVNQDTKEITVQ